MIYQPFDFGFSVTIGEIGKEQTLTPQQSSKIDEFRKNKCPKAQEGGEIFFSNQFEQASASVAELMPTLKNIYDANMLQMVMASLFAFDYSAYNRTNLVRLQLFTKQAYQFKRSDCNIKKLEYDIRATIEDILAEAAVYTSPARSISLACAILHFLFPCIGKATMSCCNGIPLPLILISILVCQIIWFFEMRNLIEGYELINSKLDGGSIDNWNQCFDESLQLSPTLITRLIVEAISSFNFPKIINIVMLSLYSVVIFIGCCIVCIAKRGVIIKVARSGNPGRFLEQHWQLFKKYQ